MGRVWQAATPQDLHKVQDLPVQGLGKRHPWPFPKEVTPHFVPSRRESIYFQYITLNAK